MLIVSSKTTHLLAQIMIALNKTLKACGPDCIHELRGGGGPTGKAERWKLFHLEFNLRSTLLKGRSVDFRQNHVVQNFPRSITA